MEIKIGLLAPSKAGKTTLLATTYAEMQNKLSGNQQGIKYWPSDSSTQNAIGRVMAEYQAITSTDDIFAIPRMSGSVETYDYKFNYTIPVDGGKSKELSVWFKDFPGGLVGLSKFEEEVGPFISESSALIVPVPADILMAWKDSYKVNDPKSIRMNIAAAAMLRINDTLAIVENWIKIHANRKDDSLLIFAPVRCEAYFNDNGGSVDRSGDLFEALDELYIKCLELTDEQKQYVQIEAHAVDTYGTVELQSVELHETPVGDMLESKFRKRLAAGNKIKSKGAFDILATIAEFELRKSARKIGIETKRLKEIFDNRSILTVIWKMIFGDKKLVKYRRFMLENKENYEAISFITGLAPRNEYRQRIINAI